MSNSVDFLRKDATFVPEVRSPTVRRRELGALLRKLRTEKGLTVEQAADRLLVSMSKLSRMETGHGVATRRDIRDLCDLYDVTDEAERDHMMNLAVEGQQHGWWQSYDLSYAEYVGLEAEAVAISAFQSSVVHGLLHTADYARAGHEGAIPRLGPDQMERQIEAKLTRQRVLTRENPPRFNVILDESALHRVMGGRQVMAAQLSQILDRSALPNVTVQVLPYDAGAHPAVESNFTILELPDPTPGVVFAEGLIGFTYLKRDEDLARYEMIFRELQSIALSPKGSLDLIRKLLQHYKGSLEASTRTFFAPGCRPARRKNCGGPMADVNRGSITQIKGARCHRRSWRLVTSGGGPPGAARATGRAWRSLPRPDRFSSATQRIRMVLCCRTRRARGARSSRRPRMVSSTWSAYSLVVVRHARNQHLLFARSEGPFMPAGRIPNGIP